MLIPAPPAKRPARPAGRSAPLVPYREGVVGHPSSINPLTPRTQADQDLVALLFRGLVRDGPDGSILPDLAESWTSSGDGRTYTFQLVGDAYWEDGEPVTRRGRGFHHRDLLQDPTYDGPYGSSWQGIHVTADGPSTVRFTMTLPIAGFLRQAALPILPQHLLQGRFGGTSWPTPPTAPGPSATDPTDSSTWTSSMPSWSACRR